MGFTLPTPAYLLGALLFSIIGIVAYYYGKRKSKKYVKWLGVALMLYPYVISSTEWMYGVGLGLCAACYYYRDR